MIDWTRLEDLAAEIGDAKMDEIISIFLEEVDAAIERLPASSDLASDLHFLKGSASNLGFSELSKKCQIGELSALAGKANAVDINDITLCYAASRADFLSGLGQHGLHKPLKSGTAPELRHL